MHLPQFLLSLTSVLSWLLLTFAQEVYQLDSTARFDERPLSCSFSRNFCGWYHNASLITIRPRFDKEEVFSPSAPASIHSAFVQFSRFFAVQGTVMFSRTIRQSRATQITFRYIVYGNSTKPNVRFLRLSVVTSGQKRLVWSMEETDIVPANTWLSGRVSICETTEFRLEFEVLGQGNSLDTENYGIGLADLIINDETRALSPVGSGNVVNCSTVPSSTSSSLTCGPIPLTPMSTFCGWQTNRKDFPNRLAPYQQDWSKPLSSPHIRSKYQYFSIETPGYSKRINRILIQSSSVWPTKPTGVFSFWSMCNGCFRAKMEVMASEDSMVTFSSLGLLKTSTGSAQSWWGPQEFTYQVKNFNRNSSVTFVFDIDMGQENILLGLDRVWYSAEPGFEEDVLVLPGRRNVSGVLKSCCGPTLFNFTITATSKMGAMTLMRLSFTNCASYQFALEADDDYMLVFEAPGYHNVTIDLLSVLRGEDMNVEDIYLISDGMSGNITVYGRIVDAVSPLPDRPGTAIQAVIRFRRGINSRTGPFIKSVVMPVSSKSFAVDLQTGYYTAEVAVDGYVTSYTTVTANDGLSQTNYSFAVSPVIQEEQTRIVLTWTTGKNITTSLSGHLVVPDGEGSFSELSRFKNNHGSVFGAYMDIVGQTHSGLETVTISVPKAGVYCYSVRLYSVGLNIRGEEFRDVLATSGARVQIVRGSAIIRTYNVPSENGTLWNVFEMDGNGSISLVNKMSYGNWTVIERTTTAVPQTPPGTMSIVSSSVSVFTATMLTDGTDTAADVSTENYTPTQQELELTSTEEPANTPMIVGVSVSVVILLILACISIALFLCHRKRKSERAQLKRSNDNVHRPSNSYILRAQYPASKSHLQSLITQYTKLLEVSYESLEIDTGKALGRGEFGIVYRGLAHHLPTISRGPTTVAVKTLLKSADPAQQSQFFDEFKVMMKAGRHVNIINILGIVHNGPMLIIEYCRFGSLLSYLRCRRTNKVYSHVDEDGVLLPLDKFEMEHQWRTVCEKEERVPESEEMGDYMLSTNDLIRFAHQISSGMEYLALRSIIHRDLAARNVLVSDDKILKISDFGLARHEGESYTMSNFFTALPILWMPPDAIINREFSEKSDVWSFGVLLWEIFSIGQVPFDQPNVTKFSAQAFASWLLEGHQMDRPKCSPLAIFELMKLCWKINKQDRPTFASIWSTLDALVSNMDGGASYLSLETMDNTFTKRNEQILGCLTEETDVLKDVL